MAALVITVLLVGELVVYAVFPRPDSALEHVKRFQDNGLVGLLTLDLLGMIAYLLFIPTILALYVVLRRTSEAIMLVSTVLFFLGIADFFGTNTAFPVLSLSNQYAAATTDAERTRTLAAIEAMFALFNENAFLVSYVMVSAAWALIAGVMLRSGCFGQVAAWAGIGAGTTGIAAVVLEHITAVGTLLPVAIALYFAAIVCLVVWMAITGRRLWQLGTHAMGTISTDDSESA